MRFERPRSAKLGNLFWSVFIICLALGYFLIRNAMEMQYKLERKEFESYKSNWINEDFQSVFRMREHGLFQMAFTDAERICQEKGYAASCLLRGLLALDPGDAKNDPETDRAIAEKYFKMGCQGEEFPVCRVISETRRDGRPRETRDEERIITGILMTGCDLGSDLACGDAAMRLFEAGDYRMARSYGTKGCAMRDPRGNPYMNPRSCQYRKLAREKLAGAAALPEDPAASEPVRDDTVSDKQ
ncbi:hypothetical protein [Succinimonas sp.]|uniref:hypothetical protein n=1 Tax=Succinimonas sp. TaxID=1936151 RepID=UPI0038682241